LKPPFATVQMPALVSENYGPAERLGIVVSFFLTPLLHEMDERAPVMCSAVTSQP
jgi:hypothetical protein